jgi:hypothetical protein
MARRIRYRSVASGYLSKSRRQARGKPTRAPAVSARRGPDAWVKSVSENLPSAHTRRQNQVKRASIGVQEETTSFAIADYKDRPSLYWLTWPAADKDS